jgi:aminoglycoside phosphotransferase family enzyme/predicted kinase
MPLPEMIEALLTPEAYPHPVGEVRLIETHISWVILAGEFAYKLKKPVDLGFLDFSTLDKRRFCCEEEIRLNRRLAPDIYLDVVPVAGNPSAPKMMGDGPVLEWAVRMRAFPADSTLDREPAVTPEQIDAIADCIARFHKSVEVAADDSPFGSPESVMHPVLENFEQLRALFSDDDGTRKKIESLAAWSIAEGRRLEALFARRKAEGFIRDCHGDLHLGNIAWVAGHPLVFDCIEFNPALRHVDIMSETAFLFMDLTARGYDRLAWRFLNRWLEHTGDYAGLEYFRFYLVYRAVVRAKVAGIRFGQGDTAQRPEVGRYLDLAERLGRRHAVQLNLMHGYSGSGKTWVSQQLLESIGLVRIRSDVERKRLFGLNALEGSGTIAGSIYSPEANRRTLERLLDLASSLLRSGYAIIVDATFLARAWRQPFFDLAAGLGIPVLIVSMDADLDLMRQRVAERSRRADDASEAGLDVLQAQIGNAEPLTEEDARHAFSYKADDRTAWAELLKRLST